VVVVKVNRIAESIGERKRDRHGPPRPESPVFGGAVLVGVVEDEAREAGRVP